LAAVSRTGGPLLAASLLTGGAAGLRVSRRGLCRGGYTFRQAMAAAGERGAVFVLADLDVAHDLVCGFRVDYRTDFDRSVGAMFFGAPYAVFPQLAARLGGPAVLGLLYAAPGFGSMVVSATSSWTRHVHRHGRAIALAVGGWGVAIAAFAYAPNLPLAVLALAAAGGSDMVSGIFRMTMWNQTIPARVRGRLAGLEMISYSTGEPLGNLEAGAVATLTGSVRIAVLSGGVLSLLGAVIVTLAIPALWRYDSRTAQAGTGSGAFADSSAALARHQS
jgi:hypothetical protein